MANLSKKRNESHDNVLLFSQALNNTLLFYLLDTLTNLTRAVVRGDFKNMDFSPEEQRNVLDELKVWRENMKEDLSLFQHLDDKDFEEKFLNRMKEFNRHYDVVMQSDTINNETKESLRQLKLVVSE